MESSVAQRPSPRGPRVPARLLRLASDERLVEHVRGGSEAAFEAMFDRHHRGILAFCRHMLGSVEEAEDAVQHVFIAAFRNLAGSTRQIQLRPWLYTIARNRCLSVLRARRERPVEHLQELPTENLSSEVQRRQDLRDMLRDVSELPEEQRAALVLAEVGGVPHDEIAVVLDVQREKVKALVFQARSSLIASRQARDTSCAEIRVQLAQLRGGALRRNTLRRHLKVCPGCRDFRVALQDQRKMLALALPVVPTIALKQGALAGAFGGGAATATAGGAAVAGAGGTLLAGSGTTMTAKVLAVAVLAGGGAVGVKTVAPEREQAPATAAPAAGTDAREHGVRPHAATRDGTRAADDAGALGAHPDDGRAHGLEAGGQGTGSAEERAAGAEPEQSSALAGDQPAVRGADEPAEAGAPTAPTAPTEGEVKPPKVERISEPAKQEPTGERAPATPEKQPAPDKQPPAPEQPTSSPQKQQQPPPQRQQEQSAGGQRETPASATTPALPDAVAQPDRTSTS